MEIGPQQFLGARNVHFKAKIQTPPSSDGRCAETRRNSGKTKTTGIITISSLPSHPRLLKFGSGVFELLCIFANGPPRFIGPAISRKRQHVQNYQSQLQKSESVAFLTA